MDEIDLLDDELTAEEALIVLAVLDEEVDGGPGSGPRPPCRRAGGSCLAMVAAVAGFAIVAGFSPSPNARSGRTAPDAGTTGSVAWSRPMC